MTMLMAADEDLNVYPFDSKASGLELAKIPSNISPANQQFIDEENQAETQVDIIRKQQIYKDNEDARLKQFMLTGIANVARAAAILYISSTYNNDFGTALRCVAGIQALYGFYLMIEPIGTFCCHNETDIELNQTLLQESEKSSATNYALTALGFIISGAELLLFSFTAPDDPLARVATVFGAAQCLVGIISCIYPGQLILKKNPLLKKYFPKEDISYQPTSPDEIQKSTEKKLNRSRLQQYTNTGFTHIARGASTFHLSKFMPSPRYADTLRTFGSLELFFGLCALYDPVVNTYHYFKGTQGKTPTLEEGSRNFYILRALGFIAGAPVNIIYTLGVPDKKTPLILAVSALSLVVAVSSGWNPVCDYYSFESWKFKKPRILPA